MATAIIGLGNIGIALAWHLVRGDEQVALAARDESHTAAVADELGSLASAASVEKAIEAGDVVVLAVHLDVMKQLIAEHSSLLEGKVVADPSNPVGFGPNSEMVRTLPEDTTAAQVIAAALPAGAHYVKALGTLSAQSLADSADRIPRQAVLFYATDDDLAASAIERVITICGFHPVKVGGVKDAGRIELPGGDLHQNGGLGGKILDADQARAAVAGRGGPPDPSREEPEE